MFKNIIKYTSLSLIVLCLSACQTDIPLDMLPKKFDLLIYNNANVVESGVVKTTDDMIDFFEKEKRGWKRDYETYIRYYLLNSEKLKINVLSNIVVISYAIGENRYAQYSKAIDTKKLISIIEQNKIPNL